MNCQLPLRLTLLRLRLLRLTLVTVLMGTQMGMALAAAKTAPSHLQFVPPNLALDPGEPGGRGRGGAGRGPCKDYEALTALVPVVKTKTKAQVWGLTTRDRPTFWFAMPVALTPQHPIRFTLQDQAENPIYQTTLTPEATPAGIMQMSLPATATPLQINHTYRWGFSVQCDASDSTARVFVQGSIRRVALPTRVEAQLAGQLPLDRAIVYAQQGIWFDALTTLGQAISQTEKPDPTMTAAWRTLLQQGNLADVAQAAIAPCCKLK